MPELLREVSVVTCIQYINKSIQYLKLIEFLCTSYKLLESKIKLIGNLKKWSAMYYVSYKTFSKGKITKTIKRSAVSRH